MTKEERYVIVKTLFLIADALKEEDVGPCHYWCFQLAERMENEANKIMEETDNGNGTAND